MGSGRSGTSMVAGTLYGAGYFMGENILPATSLNPKGYYESKDVEQINEALLSQIVPSRPRGFLGNFFRDRPTRNLRWLARVPMGAKINYSPEITLEIEALTQKQPFCFKDPRFCYTLPVWRPVLKDTVFLCIFRHPAATASSIMNLHDKNKLEGLAINFQQALMVWQLMYQHILQIHRHEGPWLFMHYDQVLQAEGLDKIESFIEGKIDRNFPDQSLKKSVVYKPVNSQVQEVYETLCKLAHYTDK
jgi:hypothetical protein